MVNESSAELNPTKYPSHLKECLDVYAMGASAGAHDPFKELRPYLENLCQNPGAIAINIIGYTEARPNLCELQIGFNEVGVLKRAVSTWTDIYPKGMSLEEMASNELALFEGKEYIAVFLNGQPIQS